MKLPFILDVGVIIQVRNGRGHTRHPKRPRAMGTHLPFVNSFRAEISCTVQI